MKCPRMRKFLIRMPVLLMLCTRSPGAEAEWRKWTSGTGSVIEGKMAELTPNPRSMTEAKLRIETKDGRYITVLFNQLSAADQAWLANHHGDALAGNAPRKTESTPATETKTRLMPMKQAASFDPEFLLVPPAGSSFKRSEIPSRGEYVDPSSDGANMVTNHLFWLCKAGYTQIEPGRDEDKTWRKLQGKVSGRFRGGNSWEPEAVAALAIEMIQREGKGVVSIRPWKTNTIIPAALDAFEGSPALILFECEAFRRGNYQWSYVAPLLESAGRNLTIFYQGERVRARLEDRKPDSKVKMPDGGNHHGYQLVFDPGDQSRLASRLRKEELDFMVEPGSFHVIDLELAPLVKAK